MPTPVSVPQPLLVEPSALSPHTTSVLPKMSSVCVEALGGGDGLAGFGAGGGAEFGSHTTSSTTLFERPVLLKLPAALVSD